MKLKKLLKHISFDLVKGSKEVEITGITQNSKLVAPGNLFVVKKGMKTDGRKYVPEAIAAGASAILSDMYDPFLNNVVQIIHSDIPSIEPILAAHCYEEAYKKLKLIAFTGTNGKTTGTLLTKFLLDSLVGMCGVIGTVEWIVGKYSLPSTHTCPDIFTSHKLFCDMVHNGCKAVTMEVSSHALAQNRVKDLQFDVAVFTNLTLDHLDYHQTMENYAAAKAKLFSEHAKSAVINADSPWSKSMKSDIPTLTYGLSPSADLYADKINLSSKGMQFNVHYRGQTFPFLGKLIGRFNVYNYLAAMGVGLMLQYPLDKILTILKNFKSVPGRLEKVPNSADLSIFVDYAHTDDALQNVLQTLGEIKKGKIITVFGCGGDRDRSKRPKMAAIAEELSDIVIVTTDNPRSEDPNSIVHEIFKGFKNPKNVILELDRSQAIAKAVRLAKSDDIVLIAGKGHETYQIFAHQTIDFDDRKEAQAAVLTLNQ